MCTKARLTAKVRFQSGGNESLDRILVQGGNCTLPSRFVIISKNKVVPNYISPLLLSRRFTEKASVRSNPNFGNSCLDFFYGDLFIKRMFFFG